MKRKPNDDADPLPPLSNIPSSPNDRDPLDIPKFLKRKKGDGATPEEIKEFRDKFKIDEQEAARKSITKEVSEFDEEYEKKQERKKANAIAKLRSKTYQSKRAVCDIPEKFRQWSPTLGKYIDTRVKFKAKYDKALAEIQAHKKRQTAPAGVHQSEPQPRKEKVVAKKKKTAGEPSSTSKLFAFWLKNGKDNAKTTAHALKMGLAPGTARVRPTQWSNGVGITQANIDHAKSLGLKVDAPSTSKASKKPKAKAKKAKARTGSGVETHAE